MTTPRDLSPEAGGPREDLANALQMLTGDEVFVAGRVQEHGGHWACVPKEDFLRAVALLREALRKLDAPRALAALPQEEIR